MSKSLVNVRRLIRPLNPNAYIDTYLISRNIRRERRRPYISNGKNSQNRVYWDLYAQRHISVYRSGDISLVTETEGLRTKFPALPSWSRSHF